jgi:hypothetical protein
VPQNHLSCTFWAGKLRCLDNVLLYTVTDRNITFFILVPMAHAACWALL